MSDAKIKTLYSDKEKAEALYPRTKIKAITDQDGVGLEAILDNIVYNGDISSAGVVVSEVIDATTLAGREADYYASQSDLIEETEAIRQELASNYTDSETLSENYATHAYVTSKIAEMASGGEIELDGYVTDLELQDALATKAPAGFGYGEVLASFTSSTEAEMQTKLSAAVDDMSNYSTKQMRGQLSFLGTALYFLVTIYRHNANYSMVTVQAPRHNGITLQTVYTSSGWSPLEWVNPPMADNVEYRTIERSGSKPVYKKRVVFTTTSASAGSGAYTISFPHNITDFGTAIKCNGTVGNYILPHLSTGGRATMVSEVNATNVVITTQNGWDIGTSFVVDVAYTKTT